MIDSHCHLDFDDFDDDREAVIQACLDKNIHTVLVPGVSPKHWHKQLSLCRQYSALQPALGIHPYFLSDYNEQWLQQLALALDEFQHTLVAVGEIGLDYYLSKQPDGPSKLLQQSVFEKQLILAEHYQLPVIIHHRQSHNDIIRILKNSQFEQRGVVHAFSGSKQEAQSYIDRGFLLGVGGTITYERAVKTRDTIREIPLEYLLLETDAPDMPLFGYQGQRNSPERVANVAACLAKLKQVSVQEVSRQTEQNFYQLFTV